MALINYANKEINAKIVYYGPGLSGKTTNIQYIYQKLRPEHRGKLITLPTQTDRTLFFDFLPVEIPDVKGFTTRFHLYTVPGQVFYNATRKMVLKGVDGVVFVADSQLEKLDDNIASIKNLEDNLMEYGKSIKTLPFVFQFNKRDLKNICEVKDMLEKLNQQGYPYYEAIATQGPGVMSTLTGISKMVLRHLKDSYEAQKILRYGAGEEGGPEGEFPAEEEVMTGEEEILGSSEEEVLGSEEIATYTGEEIKPETDDLGVMGEYDDDRGGGRIEIEHGEAEGLEVDLESRDFSGRSASKSEQLEVEVGIEKDASSRGPAGAAAPNQGAAEVELVLGGEVERIGAAAFKIPLTFRLNDIKKDVQLNISFKISDSEKDKDIF
jgi:signal recognition particle receptor subunit beta